MRVHIPTALRSYTARQAQVEASGSTVAELLADLDVRYAGLRFRIIDEQDQVRTHIKLFVNGEQVHGLDKALAAGDEVAIVMALSGGA